VPVAEVKRVVQQGRLIGADIEDDRDDVGWMNPGRGGVNRQLANRDVDAPNPQSPMPRIRSPSVATTRPMSSGPAPVLSNARSICSG
jgi:hypothetical protein